MSSLFLMVTITDRRSTDAFLQLYQQRGVDVNLRTVGSGTAVRETLAALGLPETAKVDQAASLIHMMNQNTFTAAAYHCTDDADALATALRDNIQQRQWM